MNKRLLGSISVCLTATGLTLARGEAPARLSLPAAQPAVIENAPPTQPSSPDKPKAGTNLEPPGPVTTQMDAPAATGMGAPAPAPSRRPAVDLKDCHIGPVDSFWARAEYLLWWTRNGPLPVPLATTGPALPLAAPGDVVLGGTDLDYRGRSGGRLTAGLWLDDLHHVGIEGSGFLLERPVVSGAAASDATGAPVLSRPVIDREFPGASGVPAAVNLAFPGVLSGGIAVSSASRFWGAEALVTRNLADEMHWTATLTFGFRYLSLDENLLINTVSNVLAPTYPNGAPNPFLAGVGTGVAVADGFSVQNNFYGAQIGGRVGWRKNIWTVDVESKVAFGPNHEALNVSGVTRVTGPAGAQTLTGGVLALSPNIGHSSTNWFVIVPEVGAQVGCQLTKHVRLQAGYSFLYVNSVIRPGEQVNLNVNRTLLPLSTFATGPREPAPLFRQTDFWAHGINAGVTFTY